MASAAKRTLGKATLERVFAGKAGAPRAVVAAVAVGAGAAVLTYRLLRGGGQ